MPVESNTDEADEIFIRLLLVEDNPDDAAIMLRALRKAEIHVDPRVVKEASDYLDALHNDPDIIISDHELPGFGSLQALQQARQYSDDTPFIIVSGTISEELAVEAMRLGADDYLLKDRLARLGGAVRQALDQRRVRREKREAVEEIRRSEERYRLLAVHSTDIISKHAPDGTFLYASPACTQLLGYHPSELLGHDWFDLFHPDDRTSVRDAVEEPVNTITYRIRRKDGTFVWFESTTKRVRNEEEQVTEIVSVSREITARKEAERAIQESEERWRRLIAVNPEGLLVTSEGRIVFVNEAATKLFGVENESDLMGQAADRLFDPGDRVKEFRTWLQQVEEGGQKSPEQLKLIRPDGFTKWVEVFAVATTYQGRPAIQSVVRDVSDRRKYELALIQAKERAEEMSDLKSAFLMNMSHEIRTPLTGIIGLSELLTEVTTGESSEFAGLIKDCGQRLLETLNSVLDLAALEGKGVEVNLKPTDLHKLVEATVSLFRHAADHRGLDLRIEKRPAGRVLAKTDEAALSRVLSNLLSNAVKFTRQGEIVVRYGHEEGEAYVEVEDTGIGIDLGFIPFIFNDFKQESTGVSRTHEGNGLGLSISKRLTDLLGGRILVESRKGEGSRFRVSVPLAEETIVFRKSEAPVEIAIPRSTCVLAIDDHPESLWVLERFLAGTCELHLAHDVDEAQAALTSESFDIVLIDISLGTERDGVYLATWCRRELPTVPYLVAFTAYALPNDRERFLEQGFDDYLHKPFTKLELMEVISVGSRRAVAG